MHENADDTERQVAALHALEPRAARLLELRFVEGRPDVEVAAHYGMPPAAYDVHLLRTGRMFLAAHEWEGHVAQRDVPLEVEQNEGRQLVEALSADRDPAASIADVCLALRRLSKNAAAVKARMAQLQREELDSPAAHRETLIRRALVVILVLVTLYLYFTRPTF